MFADNSQYRAIRSNVPLRSAALLLSPSPHRSDAGILSHNHYRPRAGLTDVDVDFASPLARSLHARHRQLPRNPEYDCSGEFALLLPDCVGVDQGTLVYPSSNLRMNAHDVPQGWFDEGTRTKIHVLGRDPGPTLRALIDEENLPKTYGGKLDWTFDSDPELDADAIQFIGEMPKGPALWMDGQVKRPTQPSRSEPATSS